MKIQNNVSVYEGVTLDPYLTDEQVDYILGHFARITSSRHQSPEKRCKSYLEGLLLLKKPPDQKYKA